MKDKILIGQYIWEMLRKLLLKPFYCFYEWRLTKESKNWQKPLHLALILDGNRRWAQKVGYTEVTKGHEIGAEKVREVITWCYELGIRMVTIWVFSTDNLKRDPKEVNRLMKLFEEKATEWLDDPMIHERRVRVRFIGRLHMLPEHVRKVVGLVEEKTAGYDQYFLNVAMAYGGREEITDAFRRFIYQRCIEEGEPLEKVLDEMRPEQIQNYLYVSDTPDPDLIIRTSGEIRLSGFLLWQSVYSEFYFCDTFWPAFRRIDLLRAIRAYSRRKRRFGR